MKKILFLLTTVLVLSACRETRTVTVTVSNPISLDRENEMIEVSMNDISQMLQLANDEDIVVNDNVGQEIPYQITFDEMLIFPVKVAGNATAEYTIRKGLAETVSLIACGAHYPKRVDDIAWENDLVAFRTYGPALQQSGEKAFGYDVWTKYNTTGPVVEERYEMEFSQGLSYHIDHGNGLDCYKVGPTLGGGTTALMTDGQIIYPYCYKTFEILDNGPLRFTVKLEYNPLTVKENANVIETRLISLDAGSHLNKTIISYSGLNEVTDIATGIVLHEPDGEVTANAGQGYIAYADPTDNPDAGNGKIFVGAAFPAKVREAKPVYFAEKEKKEERGGADGHVLAISEYTPGADYTYYWGSGWSKANITDYAMWNRYMEDYALKVRNPLTVVTAL